MPLGSNELARQREGVLELRSEPLRLRWMLENLPCADGHELRCVFSCSVRAVPGEAHNRLLQEMFLGTQPVLTTEAVVEHFRSALRDAATGACQRHPAAYWIDGDRRELLEAIRSAASRTSFSCGLELLAPFDLQVESRTLERQRLESLERSLAEQHAAGQLRHFARAAELLQQFESIRQSAPQLSPGLVLRQLSPADQACALQSLLMASGRSCTTRFVWAVAGSVVLRIDVAAETWRAERLELPTSLGPLRSVHRAGSQLLVGARCGVLEVDPDHPEAALAYSDSSVASQLGFSRAVLWNGQIWACHSDAGIVAWERGEPLHPVTAMRPADLNGLAPRNLTVLDQRRLIFTSQNRLLLLERNPEGSGPRVAVRPAGADASCDVVALLVDNDSVTVVLKDGRVQSRQIESWAVQREIRPCGGALAAAKLPWLGSYRLLIASQDGPVVCIGWEDELVTQYLSPFGAVRSLAAAPDLIVGLTADRLRVIVWHSWNGRELLGQSYLLPLAQHRGADVTV